MTSPKKPPKTKPCQNCQKLQSELEKMKDMAGRAQADLQNSKERLQKEAGELRKFALEDTLIKLLPTIDHFQRAFEHLPLDLSDNEWVKGVAAIERDLMSKLNAMGLEKIECMGEQVDTERHEVLQTGPGEEGIITEVFEDGYLFNGKVLRAGKVRVGDGVA